MAEVSRRRDIEVPAAEAWALVGDFAAVGRYTPMIAEVELEGERGPGQIRRLTLTDGSLTVSRCTALDDDGRRVSYEIVVTALPLADYTSTQRVEALGDGRCAVSWASRFEPHGVTEAEAGEFLVRQLDDGLAALARLLG